MALDQALWASFETDVERDSVELELDPPAEGRLEWKSDRELRFVPSGWRAGRAYRVRIGARARDGSALAPLSWQFRTQVPDPVSILPGEGAPIVLSFDDGPHRRGQADKLLTLLREQKARAIFFPTGRWAKQRADWVERARRDGHLVCNHTFSHRNLTLNITDAEIRKEIEGGAGHGSCSYFRPPLMAADKRVKRIAHELGYQLFFWDIDSRDWQDTPSRDIENLVLSQARPGAVVLLHMHSRGTLLALPRLLYRLRKAGYVLTHEGTNIPPMPPVVSGGMDAHPE